RLPLAGASSGSIVAVAPRVVIAFLPSSFGTLSRYSSLTQRRCDILVAMGRPKLHGEATAGALLETAERIVDSEGLEALTVRRVAEGAGTSTRAVYSVYGSKDGLVVALGRRAYELLLTDIEALPATDDPAADLVTAGLEVFRRL